MPYDLLKNLLKKIKLNESVLSTALGALVIIVVGVLIFNYFKTSKTPEQALEQPKEKQTEEVISNKEKTSPSLPIVHQVAKGENLWKISEKYYQSGYNWPEIAKANNLTNPDLLEKGQKLKIPKVLVKKSKTILSQKQKAKVLSIAGNTYKVQKGDYLWQIAVRAYGDGFKWPEIAKVNNLVNPDLLKEGIELKLPR